MRHILLTLCNIRDVLPDDLLDKLCNYVFTALTIISLTLEKNKEFGHGGEQGLRFPSKLSTSQTLEPNSRASEAAEDLG